MKLKTHDRGYGNPHQRKRRVWKRIVDGGFCRCARGDKCFYAEYVDGQWVGGLIAPGAKWDLGHPDGESQGGPEHRRCNRATALRRRPRRRVSVIV